MTEQWWCVVLAAPLAVLVVLVISWCHDRDRQAAIAHREELNRQVKEYGPG